MTNVSISQVENKVMNYGNRQFCFPLSELHSLTFSHGCDIITLTLNKVSVIQHLLQWQDILKMVCTTSAAAKVRGNPVIMCKCTQVHTDSLLAPT